MTKHPEPPVAVPRGKPIFVVVLILLPLVLIGVAKYSPWLTRMPAISSISIVPPRMVPPTENAAMRDSLVNKLRDSLGDLHGITVLRSPTAEEVEQANDDLPKLAGMVGADVLVLTTITVDAGIIQLSIQVFDPRTNRVLYNNPYQSSKDRYEDMVRAAGAGLKRTLQP